VADVHDISQLLQALPWIILRVLFTTFFTVYPSI